MASVIRKLKSNENLSREFQITFSANALTLECSKDVWQPEKLVIVWNKDDGKCHTKPIRWQSGCNNPLRGIHVWPEPDPVTLTTTMYKNPEREGVYQDHKWGIQIKNETKNGHKKVIATGSFDLDNYISEKKKSFEIKVTLIPTNKNVRSGFIDFQLTSVMLVDGVPYGSKEEELKEYLRDAIKSLSSLKKASGREDKDDGGCGSNGSHYDVTGSTGEQSSPQHCSLQNAEAIKPGRNSASNNKEPKKPKKNPPPVPPRSKNPCPVPPTKDMNNDSVETSGKSQHSCKKQQGKENSIRASSRSVQEKAKPKDKYPHKLNPFGESPDDEASSEELSNCGESPALNNVPKTDCKQNHQKHKRKTCGGFKKKTKGKYPKELNPFASSSQSSLASEESVGSGDVSSSTEVGETVFSNQGIKKNTKYLKDLNPFLCSSDEEELKKLCPSTSGKVLSSVKTSRESHASEKHGSKGRNACTGISSAVLQIKKGQEANSKEDIKPVRVVDHSHKNSWKDRNNFKDPEYAKRSSANRGKTHGRPALDNAAASACVNEDIRKKGSHGEVSSPPLNCDCEKEQAESQQTEIKAITDNPSQGKPEEGLEIVGTGGVDVNGNVDVTNAGPSAVDERPVGLEPISAQSQDVMSEPHDQAVKDDSRKMVVGTTLCCGIQTDSGVTVSDGCASDSQGNKDGQLSIKTDSRYQNTVSSLNEKLPPAKPPRVTGLTEKGTAPFSKCPNFKGILPPAKPPRQFMLREKVTAGSIKLLQCHSEIEAYVAEEMFFLNQEIHALSNVISKVENELQETMKFAECHEECRGLKQDWLSLNEYMDELNTRKQKLEILELTENIKQCVGLLRAELKLLFEMEDWRKSDHQRAQEASLLNLVLSLEANRRENY